MTDVTLNDLEVRRELRERAERFETAAKCLVILHGADEVHKSKIANLSKSGALLSFEDGYCGHVTGQRLLVIPLDDGFVNIDTIEKHRGILTGTIVREYRADIPCCLGVALSPYPLSLFHRLIGWMKKS